jgi:hypothetical protein
MMKAAVASDVKHRPYGMAGVTGDFDAGRVTHVGAC